MSRDYYQAEFASPTSLPAVGLFRDGRFLVVDLADHQFPDRCLKTDEPISGAHTLVEMTTYNVAAEELALVRGLVVASTNQLLRINENNKGNNVVVQLGVPLTAAQTRRLKSPWPLLFVIAAILFTIGCFGGMFLAVDPNNAAIFLSLFVGCVLGIFGMLFGFVALTTRTSRVLSIKRLADAKVWLRGAHPDWLARLPEYAVSTDLLKRDQQRSASSAWWSLATAAVFGIATLISVPIAAIGYAKGVASQNWPTAEGKIGNVSISKHSTSRRGRRTVWWHVDFDYTYQVQQQSYSGKSFEREDTEQAAQFNMQQKPPGTPIDVFYNPANPADNRTERGLSKGEIFWIVGAVVVSLIALIAAAYGLIARSRAAAYQYQLDERARGLPSRSS
jgi:hypothetical protein